MGLFSALATALTQALAAIPNLELTSLTLFLSGAFLGPASGALVGLLTSLGNSWVNPLGPSPPPLLFAQILAYGGLGALGGILAENLEGFGRSRWAAVGLGATLGFQALVQVGISQLSGLSVRALWITGAWYIAVHAVSNAVLFAVLGPELWSRIRAAFSQALSARGSARASQSSGSKAQAEGDAEPTA